MMRAGRMDLNLRHVGLSCSTTTRKNYKTGNMEGISAASHIP